MAKITIAGDAYVVTSAKTLEEIETLEKYRPDALKLFNINEDGRKEVVFAVGSTKGEGAITQYGASFSGVTHDEQKLATITMHLPAGTEDAVEYVAEKVGTAIINLNKVEAALDTALAEVVAEKAKVRENITLA